MTVKLEQTTDGYTVLITIPETITVPEGSILTRGNDLEEFVSNLNEAIALHLESGD